MAEDYEVWKNVSRGRRGIIRQDRHGKTIHELIPAGKSVKLSREERLDYQRNVASDALDIFQNGALVPVKLIDDEDVREMASNPNLLSDDELVNLFKLQWKRFEGEIAKITNVYALERLVEHAEQSDDVTVKKLEIVKSRLEDTKEASAATTKVTQSIAKGAAKVWKDA